MRVMYAFTRRNESLRASDWCFWVILLADDFFVPPSAFKQCSRRHDHSSCSQRNYRMSGNTLQSLTYFIAFWLVSGIVSQGPSCSMIVCSSIIHPSVCVLLHHIHCWADNLCSFWLGSSFYKHSYFGQMTFWCDCRMSSHPSARTGSNSLDFFLWRGDGEIDRERVIKLDVPLFLGVFFSSSSSP